MAGHHEIDPASLRRVLASFATGVTIITTNDSSGSPVGVTANSFSSVSLSPPLVLWSLSRSAFSRPAFESNGYWAVHILAHHQEELSNRFARAGGDKFAGMELEAGINGLPLIPGCAARLQCCTELLYDGGDHIILVGKVLQYEAVNASPLVFYGGRYAMAWQKGETFSLSKGEGGVSIGHTENFIGYLLWRAYFQFFAKLRGYLEAHGVTPVEYYLLCALAVRDGRSLDEVNRINDLSGAIATEETVVSLERKGFIRARIGVRATYLSFTELGQRRTRTLMKHAHELEADIERAVGLGEAQALKTLLKLLIVRTPVDTPHPWDSEPASAAVAGPAA